MSPDAIALAWLLFLCAIAVGYFVCLFRRSDYDSWESCLYLPTYLFGRLLWRVHFTNHAPPELRGGGILAANHRSSVDPFFVQLAARRRVHWMVAQEYCRHMLFGPLLRALQVIPTNRSGMDTASTKAALRITQAGRLVGMFPEGKLNQTAQPLLPLRGGAALVAIRSQVPLIPLWIEGSPLGKTVWSPLFMPARVRITFGKPIYPSDMSHETSQNIKYTGTTVPCAEEKKEGKKDVEKNEAACVDELTQSDKLIVQWGTEIMSLAGRAGETVELASQRKLRKRPHE